MSRKPNDEYAVLAVPPEKLRKRAVEKGYSIRGLADAIGHSSHSHTYALLTGKTKTTSTRTADVMEAVLDARGFFFARMSVQSPNRTQQAAA